jgi:hypothetical protein
MHPELEGGRRRVDGQRERVVVGIVMVKKL